jgi:ATP-dependent RNA helicase DDX54/DBP10
MPTPVQRKALPVVLSGVDTVVMARTGSGKTIAFVVPLIEKLLNNKLTQSSSSGSAASSLGSGVRAIILSPTRELSMQTLKVVRQLTSVFQNEYSITSIGIHGGEGMEKQFSMLASKPDIIVATPGRLAHHLTEIPDFTLSPGCSVCILDEADRLLEMGFGLQLRQIHKHLPSSCQKALFSATMPKVLVEFTKSGFATDPVVVRLDQEATVSSELRIAFITCRSTDKDAALIHILHHIRDDSKKHNVLREAVEGREPRSKTRDFSTRTGLTIIFAATRHHVEYISTLLTAAGVTDATMIYGTLDQEARKANLALFRNGTKPVLVVTDVAARGIDVPQIDHVIHYHFPSSSKLFVHRSGRAARAGRIGFCWSLVEPDEMPYMIDLHLFLGRKPISSRVVKQGPVDTDEAGDVPAGSTPEETEELIYTLDEMTPDMVHYGSVPESVLNREVENVSRIVNAEMTRSQDAESLRALTKVCVNAMKQYRRTRPEASRDAVRRAKAILEGDKHLGGQRLHDGAIPPHPLLRGMELKMIKEQASKSTGDVDAGALLDSLKKRDDFLKALTNFRPKESVFETFATGGHVKEGVASHLDKGRTTSKGKNDSSAALAAMKSMRRQMRMARDKGSALVVAGTAAAGQISDPDQNHEQKSDVLGDLKILGGDSPVGASASDGKKRLSRAERKQMKKRGAFPGNTLCEQPIQQESPEQRPTKLLRGADFRDPEFFITNEATTNPEQVHRSRQVEAAMQPSAASTIRGTVGKALRLEETMLDLVGDENEDMVKKQRMTRWDKAKRKYVSTTVGSELSGESKTKKTRLESGQLVKTGKLKLGELYEKWQKKTHRSVGRTGVFDDAEDGGGAGFSPKKNRNKQVGVGDSAPRKRDEVKTSVEIRKERERRQNMKMKNMKKSTRRVLEQKKGEKARGKGASRTSRK